MRNLMHADDCSTNLDETGVPDSVQEPSRRILPQPSQGFRQQFEFVEGLNSKAERKKTRSFVTKQHYRKKRYERDKAFRDVSEESPFTGSMSPSGVFISKAPGRGIIEEAGCVQVDKDIRLNPEKNLGVSLERIGGGRADPFESYPIPANRDVHELVDHCE